METPTFPSQKSPSLEAEERRRVIAAAREWIGTPFHDYARIKGHGVDCACLLAEVYAEAGVIPPQEIAPYSPQWMLHGEEPLFEKHVLRYAHEVAAPKPGDVVLYKIGRRMFAHGAIVVEWPGSIIHAFKQFGFVAETAGDEADLKRRECKFFSMW